MFCVNCGEKLSNEANFCPVCGEPVFATEKQVSEIINPTEKSKRVITQKGFRVIILISILVFVISSVTIFIFKYYTLSGRYVHGKAYSDGTYPYEVELFSDGTCIWNQNYHTFSGTYKCTDINSFIMTVNGNGMYLTSTFKVHKGENVIVVSGGVFDGDFFIKIN